MTDIGTIDLWQKSDIVTIYPSSRGSHNIRYLLYYLRSFHQKWGTLYSGDVYAHFTSGGRQSFTSVPELKVSLEGLATDFVIIHEWFAPIECNQFTVID